MNNDFLSSTAQLRSSLYLPRNYSRKVKLPIRASSSPAIQPDPWSLSDGNSRKPKPRSARPKHPLSDDDARRIIKKKAQYLSVLRRNQGSRAMTPKWIKRTPEQMVQYLEDDRNGQLYGKHVVAAIKKVRAMAQGKEGIDDIRVVMGGFVGKLSFREMCVVLKEQRGWRQVRDFFNWMKLQLSYRPSVVVYTIVLRLYGQVGKIKLAEQTFLEMLEVGCEPDAVACGTMLCTYARWGRHKAMMTLYHAVQEREIILSTSVYNFMLSSLQKKSFHGKVIDLWLKMVDKGVPANEFTYTLVVSSYAKQGFCEEALKAFSEMKNSGFVPEQVTYSLLIGLSVKDGDWDQAVRLYEDMRSLGIVPSNYTCASMLTLYYKTEDYPKALSLFGEMERNKIPADEVIRGLLIRIYGKLGLVEDAQGVFEDTKRLNLLTNEKTYLAMSQVHLNSGNVVKALDVIGIMKSRSSFLSRFAYIVMLQCYVRLPDIESAEHTFRALSRTGLPDAGSCNDMLNLYIRLNLVEKAKKFIAQIMTDQVHFNRELYKTVMRVLCKEGMVMEAQELMEIMQTDVSFKNDKFIQTLTKAIHSEHALQEKDENVANPDGSDPEALVMLLNLHLSQGSSNETDRILSLLFKTDFGSSIVNRVFSSFLREGNLSKAETLANSIIKLRFRLEEEIIGSLIALYGKQQKLKEAEQLFIEARGSCTSQKLIINSMIETYVRCGKLESPYDLFMESAEKGHDLSIVTASILVNALTNGGKHREAVEIAHKCLETNMELDTVAYNTFIKAMLESGNLQFASEIYEQMHNVGVPCTVQTYSIMISVYGRGQRLDKAMEVFRDACTSGSSLDEKIYMNMITHYAKAGNIREALALFTEMQEKGIKPGMVSYNIMTKLCASSGLNHHVDELLQAMERDSGSPDSFMYLSLIQAYVESSLLTEAEKKLDCMLEKGISPSRSHFSVLITAFAKAGIMDEAERLCNKMLEASIILDNVLVRVMLRGYMNRGEAERGVLFYERIRTCGDNDRLIKRMAEDLYKGCVKGTRL